MTTYKPETAFWYDILSDKEDVLIEYTISEGRTILRLETKKSEEWDFNDDNE